MPKIIRSTIGEDGRATHEEIEVTQAELTQMTTVDPGPIQWTDDQAFRKKTSTVGTTPTEIYRVELLQLTGYSINVTVIGVDRNGGAVKKVTGDFTIKRLNAAPILVGETINPPHQDTAAGTWKIDRSFVTDNGKHYGVIWVVGAATRTIDWLVKGEMFRFTPSGAETVTVPPLPNPPPVLEPEPRTEIPDMPPEPVEPEPEQPPEVVFPIGEPGVTDAD